MPIVVRIATPEHKIRPILMAFRPDYVLGTADLHVFAQTRPPSATAITTAILAKLPIIWNLANCSAAATS